MRLKYTNMVSQQGHSLWDDITPPTNIAIRIDANRNPVDHVTTVVHELIHIVFHTMFVGFVAEDLEEVMVLGLEVDMYNYIKKSPARLAKWNSIIATKLAENTEEGAAPCL